MEFEPAVDEDVPGFWSGYYKGLGGILLAILVIVQLGVAIHTAVTYPLATFWAHWTHFYRTENHTFYAVMVALVILSLLGYGVGAVMAPSKPKKHARKRRA